MADILTQDEIDRLLNATGSEPALEETSELEVSEVAAIERLTKVFVASANSALTTLLARPVSVEEGLGQVVNIADLDSGKGYLIRFPLRSGFTGELAFLLRHQEASMLADLILGGEGQAKDVLDEADLDALKEAMTQVAGSGVPTLSATLGTEVGFGSPTGQEVEKGELGVLLPWGQAFLGVGTIRVDGILETPFRILIPIGMARQMARMLGDGVDESAPDTSVRPAPAAPQRAEFSESHPALSPDIRNIDLILDIEVEVMVRLGEALMPLRDIQRLRPGSIIDLDKDTDAPVDLVVNDKTIAKGELVVVGSDHFALRITEIETPTERIRKLGP